MGRLFQKLSEAVFAFNEKVKELWGKFVGWLSSWWDPFIKKLIINK
jgi:hypothetical protein